MRRLAKPFDVSCALGSGDGDHCLKNEERKKRRVGDFRFVLAIRHDVQQYLIVRVADRHCAQDAQHVRDD